MPSGFGPVYAPDARILILGSMPGAESLRRGQYYAHPRNAFWPIMGALVGAGPDIPYAARVERLRARRIALWDVVERCRRSGSLDTSIEADSIRANDIPALLAECPGIHTVFFNGRTAEALFRRHVAPAWPDGPPLERRYLPSTSPAHAALSFHSKLAAWNRIRTSLRAGHAPRLSEPP